MTITTKDVTNINNLGSSGIWRDNFSQINGYVSYTYDLSPGVLLSNGTTQYKASDGTIVNNVAQASIIEKEAIQYAIDRWSEVANILFIEALNPGPNSYVLAINDGVLTDAAGELFTIGSSNPKEKANLFLDSSKMTLQDFAPGGKAYVTAMHELGHVLGLKDVSGSQYPQNVTVMWQAFNGNNDEQLTPMIYDIKAVQDKYGANTTFNSGDTTYKIDGVEVSDGTHTWGGGTISRITIWDAGGKNDTIDASSYNLGATIDLREGFDSSGKQYVTEVGDVLLYNAFNANIENAKGGSGDDTIYGNDKNGSFDGVNKLDGGGGKDTLKGGGGNDILTGGTGDDTFIINNGDGVDKITDTNLDTGDRVIFNDIKLEGNADNVDNGNYKLRGFLLQKVGNGLHIISSDKTEIDVQNFFPDNYNDNSSYTAMGITIPAKKHDASNLEIPRDSNNPSCPIALDLNGDGIKYLPYSIYNMIHFDIDNDGFAEQLEWLDKNDGFLVRDLNGNGKIDNQKEMFGDNDGTTAYAKLALLDTNHDNKVDSNDTGFSTLKIWQDLDSDGDTDAGELKTLTEVGITSLSLQLTSATTDASGHAIAGTSSFTKTNGTTGSAADVLFRVNQVDSIYVGSDTSTPPPVDISNFFMPIIHGYGTLLPFQYAMTQDSTLKSMVSGLSSINIATQMHEVYDRINNIILRWGGADSIVPTGSDIDQNTAKLAVLNKFLDNSVGNMYVDDAYGVLFKTVASTLLMQGALHSVFPLSYYDYETGKLVLNQTNDQILTQAKALAPTDVNENIIYWNEVARILYSSTNNDYPYDLYTKIPTAAGFPVNPPTIIGTSGDDILTGYNLLSASHTVINSGKGNDLINIGNGVDVIYNLGDGHDVLTPTNNFSSPDISETGISSDSYFNAPVDIYFGKGITFDSMSIQNYGLGLMFTLSDGGTIQLKEKYMSGGIIFSPKYILGELHFADGTVKTYADINYKIYGGIGTDSKDVLYGSSGNDIIKGLGGDDTIYGGAGNDNIDGGSGNDEITGGTGSNTISGGDGNDGLYAGSGVDYLDGGVGNDTVLYSGSTAAVTIDLSSTAAQSGGDAQGDILTNIENVIGTYYDDTFIGNKNANGFNSTPDPYSPYYMSAGNDKVSYANSDAGVTVSLGIGSYAQMSGGYADGDVLVGIHNLIGSAYNDILFGDKLDNVLNGGAGNDKLNGDIGNDTLTGGAGSDVFMVNKDPNHTDTMTDFSPTAAGETINLMGFTGPVDFAHLNITQSGNDTIISLEENQKLILQNVVSTSLTAANFDNSGIINGTTGNDVIFGTSGNDTINALAGDDKIIGDFGNDKIDGGAGIDTIYYGLHGSNPINVNLSLTTAQQWSDADGDILSNIENVVGTRGNDIIIGSSADNLLIGGVGADKLDGGAGNDTVSYMDSTAAVTVNLGITTSQSGGDAQGDTLFNIENIIGSSYNDTIIVNASSNKIDGGAGIDTVSYATSASVVNVNLAITTSQDWGAAGDTIVNVENLIGSAYGDTLSAAVTGSTINGGDGDDTINGAAGNDTLYGDAGNDTIYAGAGDDTIYGGAGNDTIFSQEGNNLINGGAGADLFNGFSGIATATYEGSGTAVSINLTTNVNSGGDAQGDTIYGVPNIIGSYYNDTLIGDGFSNNLNGSYGNDLLAGMGYGGNHMDGGPQIDTVTYESAYGAVNVNLAITTSQDWSASGDTIVNVENLIGSAYGDILSAATVGSTIHGGDGNDTINGAAGNDILYGDNGDDSIYAGDGDDIVYGGIGNDVIYGQGGNNILLGEAGADTLNGFAGIATASYATSAAGVTVNLATNTNINGDAQGDLLYGIANIIGSAFVDTLTGDANNNIITGGAGADKLDGGAGTDTASYASSTAGINVNLGITTAQSGGDAQGDTLFNIENIIGSAYNDIFASSVVPNSIDGGAGIDTVSYASSTAAVNVNLGITTAQSGGHAAGDTLFNIENIIGSSYNDTLFGSSIANIITGGAGNDSMTGGAGADVFKYSAITDSGAAAGARDIITDFVNGTDKIDLGDFAGTFNFIGTGAFTHTAHEVNYAQISGNTILSVDADGNGTTDFQIELTGLHTMTASDFVL